MDGESQDQQSTEIDPSTSLKSTLHTNVSEEAVTIVFSSFGKNLLNILCLNGRSYDFSLKENWQL